jgi:hypothetical protein
LFSISQPACDIENDSSIRNEHFIRYGKQTPTKRSNSEQGCSSTTERTSANEKGFSDNKRNPDDENGYFSNSDKRSKSDKGFSSARLKVRARRWSLKAFRKGRRGFRVASLELDPKEEQHSSQELHSELQQATQKSSSTQPNQDVQAQNPTSTLIQDNPDFDK